MLIAIPYIKLLIEFVIINNPETINKIILKFEAENAFFSNLCLQSVLSKFSKKMGKILSFKMLNQCCIDFSSCFVYEAIFTVYYSFEGFGEICMSLMDSVVENTNVF